MNKQVEKKKSIIGILFFTLLVIAISTITFRFMYKDKVDLTPDMMVLKNYDKVENSQKPTNVANVQFDAFFLKDTDGNGIAEGYRGTCNQVGKEDTLNIEVNVLSNGYLKDGKIVINANNFFFNTALLKDNEIKKNYISSNTQVIEFNNIQNGTQKHITGTVRSGIYTSNNTITAAIDNNVNMYSKVNSITFTGVYVTTDSSGNVVSETPIEKTVDFNVDWYGNASTEVRRLGSLNQTLDTSTLIKDEKLNLDFTVVTDELDNELLLKESHLTGTIPTYNGYEPTSVIVSGDGIEYTYDPNTRTFSAWKNSVLDENNNIKTQAYHYYDGNKRRTQFNISVSYPEKAFDYSGTVVEIKVPLEAWHVAYNNSNTGFSNPYITQKAKDIVIKSWTKEPEGDVFILSIATGDYSPLLLNPHSNMVSKAKPYKLYNNNFEDENEDDVFNVRWEVTASSIGALKVIMKETPDGMTKKTTDKFVLSDGSEIPMEGYSSNKGIYFMGGTQTLGEDGWIRIYDDVTNELIVTFKKDEWEKYDSENPYYYYRKIDHIRIETSKANPSTTLSAYNIKCIDDEKILNNFSLKEFEDIKYIKSCVSAIWEVPDGYSDKEVKIDIEQEARYDAPVSIANISLDKDTVSTQEIENVTFRISAKASLFGNEQFWKNGIFLVEIPEDILTVKVNGVTIAGNSSAFVEVLGYSLYQENGKNYIKVITKNEIPWTYDILVDCTISSDPGSPTKTIYPILYAINEDGIRYYEDNSGEDIYDLDGDLNKAEIINKSTTPLHLAAQNTMITYEQITDYDSKGSITTSPQIADLNIVQKSAKIHVRMTNNYESSTTDVKLQGVTPFVNNTNVIDKSQLGSTFTANIVSPIQVPAALNGIVTVYYSENELPTNDINDLNNGWKVASDITDWNNIKTYLISFGNYVMKSGETYTFTYDLKVPDNIYNDISFSHHAIYFSLITDAGKYPTSTATQKLGIRISQKFDLDIYKYQKNTDKPIAETTYSLICDGEESGNILVTDNSGKISLKNLFVGKIYTLKELKISDDYIPSDEEIKIYTYTETDSNGVSHLKIAYLDGEDKYIDLDKKYSSVRSTSTEIINDDILKATINLEDEVKLRLKLVKKDSQTNELLSGIRFKLTGLGKDGAILSTNSDGVIEISGLFLGESYTLEEVKADNHYLADGTVSFKVTQSGTNFNLDLKKGLSNLGKNVLSANVINEDFVPTVNIEIQNDPIPKYSLNVIKTNEDGEKLAGTQYKLTNVETEEIEYYTTDNEGIITITDLSQYVKNKNVKGEYILQEIVATDGYITDSTEIKFRVENEDGTLNLKLLSGETAINSSKIEENTVTFTMVNKPLFRLIKKDQDRNLLQGAKFRITDLNDKVVKDVNGNEITSEKLITDKNGYLSVNLPGGLYKVIEIEAPEGYNLPESEEDRTHFVGIGQAKTGSTEFKLQWANTINGTDSNQIISTYPTKDGGVIAAGYITGSVDLNGDNVTDVTSNGLQDALVVKYNSDGQIEWSKNVGGNNDDKFTKVIQTQDNGYIAVGSISSSGVNIDASLNSKGLSDGIIVKYDELGNFKWYKIIGGTLEDTISSVYEDNNQNVIVTGSYVSDTLYL